MKKLLTLIALIPILSFCEPVVSGVVIKYAGKDTSAIGDQNYIAITYYYIYGYDGIIPLYFEIINDDLTRSNFDISPDDFAKLKPQSDGTTWLYYTVPNMPGNNNVRCGDVNTSVPLYIMPPTPPPVVSVPVDTTYKPPVATGVLSPISQDQKEGMVYYYNYSGVLIGTAKTKEKPNIAEGLYIFRIEYVDNTFSSGKVLIQW